MARSRNLVTWLDALDSAWLAFLLLAIVLSTVFLH